MTARAGMDMLWFGEQLQKGRDELQVEINTALKRANKLDIALGTEQKARMKLEEEFEKVRYLNSPVYPGWCSGSI
jgi:hypothetical protein